MMIDHHSVLQYHSNKHNHSKVRLSLVSTVDYYSTFDPCFNRIQTDIYTHTNKQTNKHINSPRDLCRRAPVFVKEVRWETASV